MVSIAAFQAVDPGSIPGRRNFFFFFFFFGGGGAKISYEMYGNFSGPQIHHLKQQAVIAQLGER